MTDHIGLGVLSAWFGRDLLEEVIDQTGCREKRVRRLPAHVVIRYVIAMGLYARESNEEVMRLLVGSLGRMGSWSDGWDVPTGAAITAARQRLGVAPVKELFSRAAVPVAGPGTKGAWLARRRVMAIDGTSFDVADTPANAEYFGRMGTGPKASAYPKIQVTALVECGSHAVVGAVAGPCSQGERTQATELGGLTGPGMLLLADSGFYSWALWDAFAATGADLAWRVSSSPTIGQVRRLPDGSWLGLIYRPGQRPDLRERLLADARAGRPVPPGAARLVRVVNYTVPDRKPKGEVITLITTITDPADLPATDLAAAYHQRWEEESVLDEIKTHLRGGGEVLRSKTPGLAEQQLWGLLLAHYAIRALLCHAADEAGYDPDRLSFIRGLRVVRRQVTDQAAFPP